MTGKVRRVRKTKAAVRAEAREMVTVEPREPNERPEYFTLGPGGIPVVAEGTKFIPNQKRYAFNCPLCQFPHAHLTVARNGCFATYCSRCSARMFVRDKGDLILRAWQVLLRDADGFSANLNKALATVIRSIGPVDGEMYPKSKKVKRRKAA